MSWSVRMAKHRKHGHKGSRKHGRKHRKQTYRKRRTQGGACTLTGANLDYDLAKEVGSTSLKQGAEFQGLTKDYHGGGVATGAPVGATDSAILPTEMRASAGTAVLDQAITEVAGLKDGGGRRRRKSSRKASRKSRKANRKSRKAQRKSRKAQRKSRKANRQRQRHRQGGGGCLADNAATFTKDAADGMLLKDYSGAGLNPEWKDVSAAAGGDYLGPKV